MTDHDKFGQCVPTGASGKPKNLINLEQADDSQESRTVYRSSLANTRPDLYRQALAGVEMRLGVHKGNGRRLRLIEHPEITEVLRDGVLVAYIRARNDSELRVEYMETA